MSQQIAHAGRLLASSVASGVVTGGSCLTAATSLCAPGLVTLPPTEWETLVTRRRQQGICQVGTLAASLWALCHCCPRQHHHLDAPYDPCSLAWCVVCVEGAVEVRVKVGVGEGNVRAM